MKRCLFPTLWLLAALVLTGCKLDGGDDDASVHADAITYSAAISACGRGQPWQRALSLMAGMRTADVHAARWQTAGLQVRRQLPFLLMLPSAPARAGSSGSAC